MTRCSLKTRDVSFTVSLKKLCSFKAGKTRPSSWKTSNSTSVFVCPDLKTTEQLALFRLMANLRYIFSVSVDLNFNDFLVDELSTNNRCKTSHLD